MRSAWILICLVPLAGCLGGEDATVTGARGAYESSQRAVDGTFEYSLFLGITGTEGPLDWEAFEADQRAQGGQAERLVNAFDQDLANGAFGDGLLGGWMTTHFAYDEERRLVGGLFTQVLASGERNALFAPFTGPYSGTTAFASIEHRAIMDGIGQIEAAQPSDPVLCALLTKTDNWNVSSREAAEAALSTETMQKHLQDFPAGELTYYYFPELAVEEDCTAELTVASNYWTIFHTDLDAYLDPATPLPTLAKVRVDAASGAVVSAFVEPLLLRPPSLIDHVLEATDPTVPAGWQVHAFDVEVETGASILELQAFRKAKPAFLTGDETVLRDPEGRPLLRTSFDEPLHHYVVEEPLAGTWSLEYRYHSSVPQGEHAVEIHGAVVYP